MKSANSWVSRPKLAFSSLACRLWCTELPWGSPPWRPPASTRTRSAPRRASCRSRGGRGCGLGEDIRVARDRHHYRSNQYTRRLKTPGEVKDSRRATVASYPMFRPCLSVREAEHAVTSFKVIQFAFEYAGCEMAPMPRTDWLRKCEPPDSTRRWISAPMVSGCPCVGGGLPASNSSTANLPRYTRRIIEP